MQPSSPTDYQQLLSEVIKKQIVILGPDITLSKARNVKGLTVADDGTVTSVTGLAQEVTQALIDQFVQLSGLIVKKTMEPLLALSQSGPTEVVVPIPPIAQVVIPAAPAPQAATPTTQPVQPIAQPQQTIPAPSIVPPAESIPTPAEQQAQVATTATPAPSIAQVEPAKNPLAA